jgi:hypothetical protein
MEKSASISYHPRVLEFLAAQNDYFVFSDLYESLDDGTADVA